MRRLESFFFGLGFGLSHSHQGKFGDQHFCAKGIGLKTRVLELAVGVAGPGPGIESSASRLWLQATEGLGVPWARIKLLKLYYMRQRETRTELEAVGHCEAWLSTVGPGRWGLCGVGGLVRSRLVGVVGAVGVLRGWACLGLETRGREGLWDKGTDNFSGCS